MGIKFLKHKTNIHVGSEEGMKTFAFISGVDAWENNHIEIFRCRDCEVKDELSKRGYIFASAHREVENLLRDEMYDMSSYHTGRKIIRLA